MVNLTKWAGLVATIASFIIIFLPAFFSVPHEQALANLMLGEVAAMTLAHSAYRASSGKQASVGAAVAAAGCGIALILSTLYYYPVDPFLTLMFAFALAVTAGAVVALVDRFRGGEEGRQSGAQRIASKA
jgi:hypothetical protein